MTSCATIHWSRDLATAVEAKDVEDHLLAIRLQPAGARTQFARYRALHVELRRGRLHPFAGAAASPPWRCTRMAKRGCGRPPPRHRGRYPALRNAHAREPRVVTGYAIATKPSPPPEIMTSAGPAGVGASASQCSTICSPWTRQISTQRRVLAGRVRCRVTRGRQRSHPAHSAFGRR